MALIKCKECGNNISDQAYKCPNCGCPIVADEVYNDKEKELCVVKHSVSFLVITYIPVVLFFFLALMLLMIAIKFNTLNKTWWVVLLFFTISIIPAIYFYLNYKKTMIVLTNKRIIFKLYRFFGTYESDYPLRQINNINVDSIFGMTNLHVSANSQWVNVSCVKYAQNLRKIYFDLIENKYKY